MRGLGALNDEWAARLQTAIPEAYDRVIDAALAHEVDFVIIAGDMFDASYSSYCDYLHFFEGLQKLHDAGIPTYMVAGNHDPYTSWARNVGRLPESAHMLGVGVPTFELYEREGEPLCLIGGRSYYAQAWPADEGVSDGITRENAIGALKEAHPDAANAPFSIGIIHTGLDLDASKAATDEATLLAQDIDYWACGHLHRRLVRPIADDPRIVFPGCVQGRDIKESGERGCYLVELSEGVSPRLEFIPTASVAFHSLDVDVSECRTLPEAENLVKTALFRENGYDLCSEMVAHVNLVGESELHSYLRKPDVMAGMRKHINESCSGFFCDAIVDATEFPPQADVGAKDNAALSHMNARSCSDNELIDFAQNTLVQRGIPVPDALARRMGDFRAAAKTRACDLVDERGDGLSLEDARAQIDALIAEYTDREGASERSIYHIGDQLEAKYLEVRHATETAASIRQNDRELHELAANRKRLAQQADALDDDVEDIASWRDQLGEIDAGIAERRTELARLRDAADELTVLVESEEELDARLLGLTMQDDRALRDKLEEYATERDKLARTLDDAKERSAASSAAYEALLEIGESEAGSVRRRNQTIRVVGSVLLPILFAVAGVPLFVHGRQIGSLSFTVFGIALVVLAFILAAGAIFVLFRRGNGDDVLDSRRQDAHWVMLQDKKLLDARTAERDGLDSELHAFMECNGLGAADGSVRQALLLLDDAKEARARIAERRQLAMANEMHKSSASQALAELESRRSSIEEAAGLQPDATARTLDALLREKTAERDEAKEGLEGAVARIAELTSRLERAKDDRTFDEVKLDYQQIRARLRVAKHDYLVLLLAQRLLQE